MSVSTLFFISTRTYPSIVLPIVSILIPLQIQTYIGDSSRGRTKSQPGFTGSLRGHQRFFICPPTEIPPGNLTHYTYYKTFGHLVVLFGIQQQIGIKIFVWPNTPCFNQAIGSPTHTLFWIYHLTQAWRDQYHGISMSSSKFLLIYFSDSE